MYVNKRPCRSILHLEADRKPHESYLKSLVPLPAKTDKPPSSNPYTPVPTHASSLILILPSVKVLVSMWWCLLLAFLGDC